MARIEVSTSELLEAVRSATGAHVNPDDAFTVAEISEAMGAGERVTRDKLAKLKAAGCLEIIFVEREALDGRMRKVPAYRFRAPSKKARR